MVIGCRNLAGATIVVDQGLTELRQKFFPPEAKKKRLRVCNKHQSLILHEWAKS
jgi:hypothetical protein